MKRIRAILLSTLFIAVLCGYYSYAIADIEEKTTEKGIFSRLFASGGKEAAAGTTVPESAKISSEELFEGLKKEIWYIYDTRRYIDYSYAHIPDARSIPLNMLEERLDEVPKEKQILLIFDNDQSADKGWAVFVRNEYNLEFIRVYAKMEEWLKKGYPFGDNFPSGGC